MSEDNSTSVDVTDVDVTIEDDDQTVPATIAILALVVAVAGLIGAAIALRRNRDHEAAGATDGAVAPGPPAAPSAGRARTRWYDTAAQEWRDADGPPPPGAHVQSEWWDEARGAWIPAPPGTWLDPATGRWTDVGGAPPPDPGAGS